MVNNLIVFIGFFLFNNVEKNFSSFLSLLTGKLFNRSHGLIFNMIPDWKISKADKENVLINDQAFFPNQFHGIKRNIITKAYYCREIGRALCRERVCQYV